MRSRLGSVLLAVGTVAVGAEAAAARPPVGLLSPLNGDGPTLARLDPLTLRPVGPRIRLGEYHDAWSFSPDGSQLALGMGGASTTCGRGICIVDLDSMRIQGYVAAPISAEALEWLGPRRIIAVLQSGGIVVADPVTGTIVRRLPLPFTALGPPSARTPAGFAVLMDSRLLQLVVVSAQGRVRTAGLRGIRHGPRGLAGLAVDRRGSRAFVYAAGGPVAEVSLRTMRVRYRRVVMPRRRRGPRGRRLTSAREALWLGRGLVAVFGEDHVSGPGGRLRGGATFPAGVHVIDTETWTARTVESRAARTRLAAGRLLVHTWDVSTPPSKGWGCASTPATDAGW